MPVHVDSIGMGIITGDTRYLLLSPPSPQTITASPILNWLTASELLATDTDKKLVSFTIKGGIIFILPGIAGSQAIVRVPKDLTITAMFIVADISGSAVVDIWKDTYANYPPTVADTIIGGGGTKPTLSSAIKNTDSTLTGWTKTFSEGDWLIANVDSASTCNEIIVILTY